MFRRLAPLLVRLPVERRTPEQPIDQRSEEIDGRHGRTRFRRRGGSGHLGRAPRGRRRRQRAGVAFLGDHRVDKLVAVPGDRAHELRIARIISKAPPDRPHRLAQGAVRDDDVAPDAIEDLLARHRPVPFGDQEHEQVEVPRDHRHVVVAAPDDAVCGRDDERAEPVSRQGHAASIVPRSLRSVHVRGNGTG